ncbi:MAG: hypothetical protein ABIK82_10210 [Pseudomonadota bacterium]
MKFRLFALGDDIQQIVAVCDAEVEAPAADQKAADHVLHAGIDDHLRHFFDTAVVLDDDRLAVFIFPVGKQFENVAPAEDFPTEGLAEKFDVVFAVHQRDWPGCCIDNRQGINCTVGEKAIQNALAGVIGPDRIEETQQMSHCGRLLQPSIADKDELALRCLVGGRFSVLCHRESTRRQKMVAVCRGAPAELDRRRDGAHEV